MQPLPLHIAALAMVFALAGTASATTPDWFTVHGDATAADKDTVQVDPIARSLDPRVMAVRVSRAAPRISWDGIPYRSFVAEVAFDCAAGHARYRRLTYYLDPLWKGTPLREVDYTSGPPRMMEFREVEPNPTQRIVSAACQARR